MCSAAVGQRDHKGRLDNLIRAEASAPGKAAQGDDRQAVCQGSGGNAERDASRGQHYQPAIADAVGAKADGQPNQEAAEARQRLQQGDAARVRADADQVEVEQNVGDAQQRDVKQQAVAQKKQHAPIQAGH